METVGVPCEVPHCPKAIESICPPILHEGVSSVKQLTGVILFFDVLQVIPHNSPMNQALTARQQEVYSKIRDYIKENGESPTLGELRDTLKVESINTVVHHLIALERKGYILRKKHAKRNISLRETDSNNFGTSTVSVPVVASVGCDDLSTFANGRHDESIEVDKKLIENKGDVVAVRATGNSMNDADIHDGDYILVQLTENAKNGDRVAAIVGDMVTVKKYEKNNGVTVLRPESKDPKYKPIILSEDFKIAGKVLCTIPSDSMDITEVVYD